MDIIRLGQLLYNKRIERNITLRTVEKETGIGISTLSRLEVGFKKKLTSNIPRIETIQVLVNWLGISIDSILETHSTHPVWNSILCDTQIMEAVSLYQMIDPFVDHKVQDRMSFGLQPFGYDIRTGSHYKRLIPKYQTLEREADSFDEGEGDCTILPYSYALLESLEYFKIPPNILCLVQGKSTYARMGLILNCTPGDPGWEGRWTLCAVNPTSSPIIVWAGQGIAQVLFFAGSIPQTQYQGKYQGDDSVTPAK